MKKILFVILLTLLVAGCVEYQPDIPPEEYARAGALEEACYHARWKMKQFEQKEGTHFTIINVFQTDPNCLTCWQVDFFFRYNCTKAAINVTVEEGKVKNATYSEINYCIIDSFEKCYAAGYPIMESYPRQCSDGNQTYVENVTMALEEAIQIAEASECTLNGTLTNNTMYNNYTRTWWIDLDINKTGCSPACVVYEANKTAEINWRCTGLIT